LAALASISAFAQSSVSLTGAVDVAYGNRSTTAATGASVANSTGIQEGGNTANRLNFLMTEDLGGGITAGAMVETGMNITNGQLLTSRAAAGGVNQAGVSTSGEIPLGAYSTSTNRQSYVFEKGSFGEVRLGYQRTNQYEMSTYQGYMVGQEQYGSLVHTINNAKWLGTRGNFVTYITPELTKGLTATLQVGSGGDRDTFSTDNAASTSGYTLNKAKRWAAKVDYTINSQAKASWNHSEGSAIVVASTAGVGTNAATAVTNIFGAVAATAATAANYTFKMDQFAGQYAYGNLTVAGQYLKGSTANTDASAGQDYKSTQIGAIYNVGQFGLFAKTGKGTIGTQGAAALTNDIKESQYGVRYAQSKRTTLYIVNGTSKDAIPTSGTAAAKGMWTAVGMAHSF